MSAVAIAPSPLRPPRGGWELPLSPRAAVLRPQRPRGCRPSGAADVLARWLPRCSSFLSLGLQWKTLSLGARRSRPPHDPISIEPTRRTLNDE